MALRAVGVALSLLAFAVTIFFGLWVGNPVTVTLSRAIWAMVVFFLIGSALGWVVHVVVREHIHRRETELFTSEETDHDRDAEVVEEFNATEGDVTPMGT